MRFLHFRHLKKNWATSIINVIGLATGLTVFILLSVWVKHELSYDRFHENAAHIFRPSMNINFAGIRKSVSRAQSQLLPWLQKNFPQLEKGTRFYNPSRAKPFVVRQGDNLYEERKFYYADSTFFDVFSFRLLKGNPQTALRAPKSVVLTERIAAKYFGQDDPLGKGIEVNDEGEYVVTGVLEDIPTNSFLQPEFIASFSTLPVSRDASWGPAFYETYVVIDQIGDLKSIEQKTNEMVAGLFKDETASPGDYVKYDFMPFQDLYLTSRVQEGETTGSLQSVYLFGIVAFIVLLVAVINYVNLSVALAASRAKEVGVKKMTGALRSQLIWQIILETSLVTLFVFALAFAMVILSLDKFNAITLGHFTLGSLVNREFLFECMALYVGLVCLVGLYPAFVITSFKPAVVLKGNFKTTAKGVSIRKLLLAFQFTASFGLIAGSLIIMKQMRYIHQQELGYDKDHTLIVPLDPKSESVYGQLRTELMNSGTVTAVSRSTETPIKISSAISINIEGQSAVRQVLVNLMAIDTAFLPSLAIPIVEGRNFTAADVQSATNDTTLHFIINESAVKAVLPGRTDVIGSRIDMDGTIGEVVGVMKDFHFAPMQQQIGPLLLYPADGNFNWTYLHLKAGNAKESIEKIEKIFQSLLPHRPFEFHFLDELYDAQYAKEERTAMICNFFSVLTIGISFVGLVGLIAFAMGQRTKEIAMRRVLGASAWNLFGLLLSDFKMILIASILVGGTLAFWLGDRWLNQFAFKIDMDAYPFVVSGAACFGLFLILILFHVQRAMHRNATIALKTE